MYFTLGDITFSGSYSPKAMTGEFAPRYARQDVINGKTYLQRTGTSLDQYSLDIFLHYSFVDVQAAVDGFKAHMEAGDVLTYADAAGNTLGDFVITRLSVKELNRNHLAEMVTAEVSLSLLEYVDPDPQATIKTNAVGAGLAIAENGVVPVRAAALPLSASGEVIASVTSANAAATQAEVLVRRAVIFAPERESLLSQIDATYRAGAKGLAAGIEKAAEIQTLSARAPALLADMASAKDALDLAAGAARSGDLTNLRAAAANALTATDNSVVSGQNLTIDIISRRV